MIVHAGVFFVEGEIAIFIFDDTHIVATRSIKAALRPPLLNRLAMKVSTLTDGSNG